MASGGRVIKPAPELDPSMGRSSERREKWQRPKRQSGARRQGAPAAPSGVAVAAGPVGPWGRAKARWAEAAESASMRLAMVVTTRAPKITRMVGVIVALPWRFAQSVPCLGKLACAVDAGSPANQSAPPSRARRRLYAPPSRQGKLPVRLALAVV